MRIQAKLVHETSCACPGTSTSISAWARSWKMPWSEGHQLQLRWDVFNVTNTQHFGFIDRQPNWLGSSSRSSTSRFDTSPQNWSNFVATQGTSRVMQIGARYSF